VFINISFDARYIFCKRRVIGWGGSIGKGEAIVTPAVLPEVIDFFKGLGDRVDVIETHISMVFLTGDRAFKIKKPVKFPYLDYSTLDLRKALCEEELRINRRTAPSLYLGVRSITREENGSIVFDGAGEILDWAVEMAQFDPAGQFDQISPDAPIERELMERLAQSIALFHRDAEVRSDKGGFEGLNFIVENNAECLEAWGKALFEPTLIAALNEQSRIEIRRIAEVLERRKANRRVRHCHGDLHLRNICLVEGEPVLFDAIEFSDDISCIDVLYDLAFLLMDLDFRGRRREASLVFNRYMDIAGDVRGLGCFPLMMSLRAAIRAHVGASALDASPEEAWDPVAVAEAQAYLTSALAYLQSEPPRLVAMGGLSGSGKSRLARKLAPLIFRAPGALVLRTDAIRKRLVGKLPLERLDKEAYTPSMSDKTYDTLYENALAALKAGHTVIADAVFARSGERQAIEAVAHEAGVPFQGLWVDAPFEVRFERVSKRKKNVSDANGEVAKRQENYDLGEMAWAQVDSAGEREQTVANALEALGINH